ncbi:MAG: acyl-CoA desaturase [Verrucomicrobiota bacterium]
MFRDFPFKRVNWSTSGFLIVTFFVAIIGVPLYWAKFGIDLFHLALFLGLFIATGMSITLGYHRLFAHRAFQAKAPVRFLVLLFGASAFEDSALDWASDHRNHHKHTDHEEDDPYSIQRGFFWAHIGWIFFKLYPRKLDNVKDLRKDKMVMVQHKFHLLIGLVVGLLLPTAAGFLWDGWVGALGGFLIGGIAKVVAVQHCTFLINSLCHTVGSQPYCSKGSSRDSFLMAIFTFGEGYHNYHHTFQHDFRNGVKWWQWDPTKWVILILSKLGLASGLRQVSPEKIVLAELRETQKKTREPLQQFSDESKVSSCPRFKFEVQKVEEFNRRLVEYYSQIEDSVAKRLSVPREILDSSQKTAEEMLSQIWLIQNLQVSAAR